MRIAKPLCAVLIAISGLTLQAATQRGAWEQPADVVLHATSRNLQRDTTVDPLVRRYEVPGEQVKDRWIRAIDFHPSDSSSIRSAFFFVDKTGQWLGSWRPGEKLVAFPESVAALLPAASKVVIEIHYSQATDIDKSGDQSLALYFTDKKPLRPLTGIGVEARVEVPAGGDLVRIKKEFAVISDSYALSVRPEMLTAGRSVEITMLDPSGGSAVLLNVEDFSKENGDPYIFEQPLFIPKGTRIVATAVYQNSEAQTLEDLFKLTVSMYPSDEHRLTSYEPTPRRPVRKAAPKKAPAKKAPAKKAPAPKRP